MKAAILSQPGLAHLAVREVADPSAGPGEVLVRMRAATLNYRDTLVVEGGYGSHQRSENLIPLSDGAGEVVAVGDGVRRFAAIASSPIFSRAGLPAHRTRRNCRPGWVAVSTASLPSCGSFPKTGSRTRRHICPTPRRRRCPAPG